MQTWKIGSTTVTRIEEQLGPSGSLVESFLTGVVRERFNRHLSWMVPVHFDPALDRLITSIHSWLIRTDRHTILLDCCAGNHKERPSQPRFHRQDIPFLERLQAAGARPEDIDIVLCTHLHADHVGWNTRLENGRWVPTFPNARYLFSRIEHDYWGPGAGRRAQEFDLAAIYNDSILPVIEAKQAVLLDGAHAIDDRLMIEPSPGHTPGHVVLKLDDGGNRALFCGDTLHHPVQVYEPTWNSCFCEDPVLAQVTRRKMLEHCCENDALLFPTHFAAPHVTAIKREGDGFRPEFIAPAEAGF